MLFPSHSAAVHCRDFMLRQDPTMDDHVLRILDFVPSSADESSALVNQARFSSIFYPKSAFKHAKTFWQHTGEGVSSRRAEYCRKMYEEGLLVERTAADDLQRLRKGPRRYRKIEDAVVSKSNKSNGSNGAAEIGDRSRFVEERFGRNLNMEMSSDAKIVIRRRVAGSLTMDVELGEALQTHDDSNTIRKVSGFSVEDVYLYPCGMNSIYKTHQTMLQARGAMKSICFGYVKSVPMTRFSRLTAVDSLMSTR